MIDLQSDLYTYINAQSSITTLTSTRIWAGHHFPPPTYRPNDGPAILMRPRGGNATYDRKVHTVSFQFKFYGEADNASLSPQASAQALYEAVYAALDEAQFGDCRYGSFSVLGQYVEEFPIGWTYILAFYDCVGVNP